MGGGFTGIFWNVHGRMLRRKKNSYERRALAERIAAQKRAISIQKDETVRGRAILGQTLAARGLSKSSIAEQDKARFEKMRHAQYKDMKGQLDTLYKYRSYMRSRMKWERRSQYAGYLDAVVGAISLGALGSSGQGGGQGGGGGDDGGTSMNYSSPNYYGTIYV